MGHLPPKEEPNENSILAAIKEHLRKKHEEIVEDETEKAAERIRQRMMREQDQVVLYMAKEYSIERMGTTLRIDVRHFFEEPNRNEEHH